MQLFAKANVATSVFHQGSELLAQALFTPLLAGWSIWVGIAISSRSTTFALRVIDGLAWRVVSAMFDRERLSTGAIPSATTQLVAPLKGH